MIGDGIGNEEFKFMCLGNRWTLIVTAQGLYDDSSDDMIHVGLVNETEKPINIDFCVIVRYTEGKVVNQWRSYGENFTAHSDSEEDDGYYRTEYDFARRADILDALEDGTLTFELRMRLASSQPTTGFVPENPILKNILGKFLDEESADVVFDVSDGSNSNNEDENPCKRAKTATSFHAHRFILRNYSTSNTLAELCNAKGGDTTTIQISDVKPTVFQHLLYYLYGGKLTDEELESNSRDIINAADKYGIASLKLEAEAYYVKSTTLTIDNMLDNLLYADSKNLALLKEAVMEYVVENGEDIVGKVSFENVPGHMISDLLVAMNRGKKKVAMKSDASDYKSMKVTALRNLLLEKGLEVDGSREAMIALLEKKST